MYISCQCGETLKHTPVSHYRAYQICHIQISVETIIREYTYSSIRVKLKILCSISSILYGIVLLKSHIQWQYNVLLVNEHTSPSINNILLWQSFWNKKKHQFVFRVDNNCHRQLPVHILTGLLYTILYCILIGKLSPAFQLNSSVIKMKIFKVLYI